MSNRYPADVFFDIETLVNVAQPSRILLLGDDNQELLQRLTNYAEQKHTLNQDCSIAQVKLNDLDTLSHTQPPYDLGIALDLFEHIDKPQGRLILSQLRDVLTRQYCVCLPLTESSSSQTWALGDLFSFALRHVASYQDDEREYGLFKYQLNTYKNTPDWLNADNWSNPQMWGKYRW